MWRKPSLASPLIAWPSVGMHRACRYDAILDEASQNRSGEVGHPTQPYSPDLASVDLGGDRDDGLLDRLAAPHSSLHAPDIALVHLHNAAQLVAIRSDHGPAELVEPDPRCLVASQSEHALEPESIGSVFLARELPGSEKPQTQGRARAVEHGSRQHRGLPSTVWADETPPRCSPDPSQPATAHAHKPFRPAQTLHVLQACRIVGEELVQLQPRTGIVHAATELRSRNRHDHNM